ncbi:DEAD/DEAH box helicase family protein [Mycoplasma sp. M5725]|uniref:DEAD/DEAH box helicase family protein n=1 Tax=Mycoplasma phocimorsus TaxID=3045839 RepID=A0AAJ1PRS4_9MOLU|nr:DEAD/DEAH box helicase family protein [Mycoplasma phocimorsus]MDJ1645588.1 DEAD/DEAH box helicase family protein [Mycoplasma phocimorsus]
MRLSNQQKRAVEELIDYFRESYKHKQNKEENIVEFKAPTGSGKTFMIANFIDKAATYNKHNGFNKKIIFVVMTVSTAELPKQLFYSFEKYKDYLENKLELEFEHKQSPSASKVKAKDATYDFKSKDNKVFIFGASSFGKGTIFKEQGVLDSFIHEIKENYHIVYIRDEAHIGTAKVEAKNDNITAHKAFSNIANFQILMTATPKGEYKQITITEKDLENDNIQLLKTEGLNNQGIEDIEKDEISDVDILEKACEKFKEIKKHYIQDEGLIESINPAMLIQVSDKSAKKAKEHDEAINKYIKILQKYNLTWVKYFSDEKVSSNLRGKFTLKEISKNNSDIDVIIFKVGPATGWNIPRACMLVQIRDISSDSLNIQTLGRIKRNPNPYFNFKKDSWALKYWVYSNYDNMKNSDIKQERYKLNNKLEKDKFYCGIINDGKGIIDEKEVSEKIVQYIKNLEIKFKDDFGYFLKEYNKNGFIAIYGNKKYNNPDGSSKKQIEFEINNIIELKRHIKKFLDNKKKIFTDQVIKNLKEYFKEYIKKYNVNYNLNLFWFVIWQNYLTKIINKFNEIRKEILRNKDVPEYRLSYGNLMPTEVINVVQGSSNWIQFDEKDLHYAYTKVNVNTKNKKAEHYFDSKNEKIFVEEILSYWKNNVNNKQTDIFYETNLYRNPVKNGVYFQYYNEQEDIATQYPDFILTYKDDKLEHQLSIEIKGISNNDINETKTEKIINSYREGYYTNEKRDLFQVISSILIEIDQKEKNLYLKGGGSSNKDFHKIIAERINNKIRIDDIYKWIVEFKKNKLSKNINKNIQKCQ